MAYKYKYDDEGVSNIILRNMIKIAMQNRAAILPFDDPENISPAKERRGLSMPSFDYTKYIGSAGGETAMGVATSAEAPAFASEGLMAGGGGSAAGSGSAGGGAGAGLATAGWVAAAIAAQHALSKNTDTEFEGVETSDVFEGHFMTEPWLGFAYDKLGMKPSAGERFDAAVKNKDYDLALKRLPSAVDYWVNPPGHIAADVTEELIGKDAAGVLFPLSWLFNKLGGE